MTSSQTISVAKQQAGVRQPPATAGIRPIERPGWELCQGKRGDWYYRKLRQAR